APHGPIVFAGSDLAHEHAGWFEGALASGADAARQLGARLARRSAGDAAGRLDSPADGDTAA
ncbi:MAG TPA: hypothetical protein VGK92_13480, partial [Gaiellales bacterium]